MIRWIKKRLWRLIGTRGHGDYIRAMVRSGECLTGLDIGCGQSSVLAPFRPPLRTVGLDAFEGAINEARARRQHDEYVLADVLKVDPETILERAGRRPFDLVTLIDVIEHFPKRQGFELLERCERLSAKYVILVTPNGFLAQGPEYGNPYQRHLSGWFGHDFEGLGYTVRGMMGTRFLRGYAALPRYNFPGALELDWVLSWLLRAEKNYRRAFSLLAIKDVRGTPARLGGASGAKLGKPYELPFPRRGDG
ncbi:MAG TPA: class I SAM-dependent methyltransferase [Candidatus Acidoferrum sp.]|jgi:hypothetical protein|nr:class I SAM-dependent methyltransferase [Candidatus Acidoferrum sp.]